MTSSRAVTRAPAVPRGAPVLVAAAESKGEVTLLDYGAGNVRSVRNAIQALGFTVKSVDDPAGIAAADKLIFPGVGAYGSAMDVLKSRGLVDPIKDYVASGKPFMGVCLGLQGLVEYYGGGARSSSSSSSMPHAHARLSCRWLTCERGFVRCVHSRRARRAAVPDARQAEHRARARAPMYVRTCTCRNQQRDVDWPALLREVGGHGTTPAGADLESRGRS